MKKRLYRHTKSTTQEQKITKPLIKLKLIYKNKKLIQNIKKTIISKLY